MSKLKVYNKQELCSIITYEYGVSPVHIENYTDIPIHCPFGLYTEVEWDTFVSYLRSRCFPEERRNKKDLLKTLGIDEYNPFEIIKKTQGRMAEDFTWMEFLND